MQGVTGNQDPRHGGKTNESIKEVLGRLFQPGNGEMEHLATFCGIDIKDVEASVARGEDTPLVRMLAGLFLAVMTKQTEHGRRIKMLAKGMDLMTDIMESTTNSRREEATNE